MNNFLEIDFVMKMNDKKSQHFNLSMVIFKRKYPVIITKLA